MIQGENNKLDDLFRSKLEHFAPEPPPRVWEKVQAAMGVHHRRSRLVYLRWAAAAAVLLLAVVTGVLIKNGQQEISPRMAGESPETTSHTRSSLPETVDKLPVATVNSPVQASGSKMVAASVSPDRSQKQKEASVSTEKGADIIPERNITFMTELKRLPGYPANPFSETPLAIVSNRKINNGIIPVLKDELLTASATGKKGTSQGNRDNWEVGLHVSPAYASYTSSHSAEYNRNMTYSGHQPRADLGGGLCVRYAASGRLRIESGLYYSRASDESGKSILMSNIGADYASVTGEKNKYYATAVMASDGQISMNSTAGVIKFSEAANKASLVTLAESAINLNTAVLTSGELTQVFDLMEIPLNLRYRIYDAKIGVELIGGISTGLVVGNNVFMENSSGREKVGTTSDISTVNFSGLAGIGMKYPLGKNLALSVEPRASYFLNSINHSGEVNFKPWRIGLFTGLSYRF